MVLKRLKKRLEDLLEEMRKRFSVIMTISNSDDQLRLTLGSGMFVSSFLSSLPSNSSKSDRRKENRGKRISSFPRNELKILATHVFCEQLKEREEIVEWLEWLKSRRDLPRSSIVDIMQAENISVFGKKDRESIDKLLDAQTHHIEAVCILRSLSKRDFEEAFLRMCILGKCIVIC
jgi:hypothetical protein